MLVTLAQMIISKRILFKGLTEEPASNTPDELFHRGHALAVSAIAACVACASIGLSLLTL